MDSSGDQTPVEQNVVLPLGILSTCHGPHRRSYETRTGRLTGHGDGRVVSMIVGRTEHFNQPDQDSSTSITVPQEPVPHLEPSTTSTVPQESVTVSANEEESGSAGIERPPPVVVDFAPVFEKDRDAVDTNKRHTKLTFASIPEEEAKQEQDSSNRSSRIFRRLSYAARSFVGSHGDRRSGSIASRSPRHSNRLSALFRPRYDSYDFESHASINKPRKRDSKAVPKSWRFLGIDTPGVADAVSNVTNKLRNPNWRDMYQKAMVKQEKTRRSRLSQLIFKYTFYVLLVATVYLLLVGLPLWRGLVWYMYILFEKHLVLKAGLTITFGLGFLYAYCPLLINFEPTAPLPEADESGRAVPRDSDTALIIPCYKSAKIIGATLEAALKIFPKQNIFVIANGNSPEPLDNTAEVCKEYDVSHTWSPLGSKIIAQFVGCYVARKFPHVLLIDDDCALPPNLRIVSERLRGNIKCIGYIMKVVGANGSKGTLCQQAQDLEYKLSGLAKAFAGKVGSVTFPHGCIVLWDRELLVQTFQEHPGFSVRMYYDLMYILFDWKLGFWEIGAKIFVFQEIYETLLYLLAPFVIPISFATRPMFALEIYMATIVMYIINALIFNQLHLRSRKETVSFKAFVFYVGFKWVLGFINIASCYYAIYTYATYFAKRHPKVIEDDKAVEIVLSLERKETYVSKKGEVDDLNELMYKIAKPIETGGKRRSVFVAKMEPGAEW
ncbi:MAG: hypothetical protein Q9225_002265 [Loekoesia sp. 1 TL-2023]